MFTYRPNMGCLTIDETEALDQLDIQNRKEDMALGKAIDQQDIRADSNAIG